MFTAFACQPPLDAPHPCGPCTRAWRGTDDRAGQSAPRLDRDDLDLPARRRGQAGPADEPGVRQTLMSRPEPPQMAQFDPERPLGHRTTGRAN